MNKSELARLMLEWEEAKRKLDELADEIKATVLVMEESQEVGNVKARFNKGRKRYDYRLAVADAELSQEQLKPFETASIDYKAVCEEYKIKDIKCEEGAPSVSIKID